MEKNNVVKITGVVITSCEFNHSVCGEDFYMFYISTKRKSEHEDILPVMISSKLIDLDVDLSGKRIKVEGTFRSWNLRTENGRRSNLILYIFADCIAETEEEDDNFFWAEGFVCKRPTYRKTPYGREISDIILAVNHNYGKSYYLPVIAWSRNAVYMAGMDAGTKLQVTGRIQSREYLKSIGDGKETRVAYEVSASRIDVCRAAGGGSYECEGDSEEPAGEGQAGSEVL